MRLHHGLPGRLQLFEIRLEPGLEIGTHAHADDEIVAVVEGELHVGRRVCGAGSSIFIPGNTLYGFRAGPDGCRYLNFRAEADSTYLHEGRHRRGASLTLVAPRHLVLVGPMGSGKSTIGRRVAAALGPAVRRQRRAARAAGRRLGRGAVGTRRRRASCTGSKPTSCSTRSRPRTPSVIAAAASTIEDARVRDALHDARVVWLRADPAVLAARMPSATRPFGERDPAQLVAEQARVRDPLFAAAADATFDTGSVAVDVVVGRVVASAGSLTSTRISRGAVKIERFVPV